MNYISVQQDVSSLNNAASVFNLFNCRFILIGKVDSYIFTVCHICWCNHVVWSSITCIFKEEVGSGTLNIYSIKTSLKAATTSETHYGEKQVVFR